MIYNINNKYVYNVYDKINDFSKRIKTCKNYTDFEVGTMTLIYLQRGIYFKIKIIDSNFW